MKTRALLAASALLVPSVLVSGPAQAKKVETTTICSAGDPSSLKGVRIVLKTDTFNKAKQASAIPLPIYKEGLGNPLAQLSCDLKGKLSKGTTGDLEITDVSSADYPNAKDQALKEREREKNKKKRVSRAHGDCQGHEAHGGDCDRRMDEARAVDAQDLDGDAHAEGKRVPRHIDPTYRRTTLSWKNAQGDSGSIVCESKSPPAAAIILAPVATLAGGQTEPYPIDAGELQSALSPGAYIAVNAVHAEQCQGAQGTNVATKNLAPEAAGTGTPESKPAAVRAGP